VGSHSVTDNHWRPLILILANLFAAVLVASWLLEPTRSLWLALDEWAFWAMNNSLAEGWLWQRFWAVANNRAFDLVPAVLMVLLYGHYALRVDRANLNRHIAIGVLLLVTILLATQFGKMIPIKRPSATFAFPDALRLSQLVPEIYTKDTASDSFPGDHGLVLFMYAGFVIYYLPRIYGILATLLMILFTMPRLMGGSHWLTDEVVGAVAVGAVSLSWVLATPLHIVLVGKLENWVSKRRDGQATPRDTS